MSFRFWRRIRIAPGVTLTIPQDSGIGHAEGMPIGRGPWMARVNLSKSGGSLSFELSICACRYAQAGGWLDVLRPDLDHDLIMLREGSRGGLSSFGGKSGW